MAVAKQSYEELRKQRLEENKKRMEELRLPQLCQALKPAPKPSPMKRTKPRIIGTEIVEVRRSGRVANKPAPVHKEIVVYESADFPRRRYTYTGMELANQVYVSNEARDYAISKAEELEAKLEVEDGHPSFVKPMLQSHVTGGFWLGLPGYFCRNFLPMQDETVTLIDEENEEFPMVYLARRTGLSGGWREFSIIHGLVDGDALVFQIIRPTVFKVYIIRCNSYEDGKEMVPRILRFGDKFEQI